MPIYAYRCAACGHSRDVLQKLSDAPLTVCPACGAEQFTKQITAAGFQLKGSGWYATDFRNGSGASAPPAAKPEAAAGTGTGTGTGTSSGGTSSGGSSSGDSSASTTAAGGTRCGGSCACH